MDNTSAPQPFDEIHVVEFGQFVAVPFCGQLLAEGGAKVIKVEAPTGDPNRRMNQLAPGESRVFISRNRGKHSLPLKLRDSASRPVIDALLDWADVVLMNFRPGLGEKMGLDTATLASKFPRLVIGDITPFGKQGPDANLAAMDIVVQARSGLMAAQGRMIDGRPAPGDPVISDYMAATTLAFGIASALLRRERTGRGGTVDVSLMKAAMTLANNQQIRSEDKDRPVHQEIIARLNVQRRAGASYARQRENLPTIRVLPMRSVYFRTYDAADGAIAIACASKGLQQKFMKALGLEDPGIDRVEGWQADYYESLREKVEAIIRSRSAGTWVEKLNASGVPVSTVKFPVELFEDEQAEANHMFYVFDHPTAGRFRALTPPLTLDDDGFQPRGATAPFGSETASILGELGFSEREIEVFIQSGVTHRGL